MDALENGWTTFDGGKYDPQGWHTSLRVIQGVLLSASIGAFAASGAPAMLRQESGFVTYRSYWIILTSSVVLVAFDAWYQFSVNGQHIDFREGNKYRPFVVTALIVSMAWTSFLPFQFLVRVLNGSPASFVENHPIDKLFGFSLLAAVAIGIIFTFLVIATVRKEEKEEKENRDVGAAFSSTERKMIVAIGLRLVAFIVLVGWLFAKMSKGHDSVRTLSFMVLTYVVTRAIETVWCWRVDVKVAKQNATRVQ
jgi:hypothetical protein